MAILWNPNSELLREPNLLIHRRKPVGSVKIDWSHHLSKGLKLFIICDAANRLLTNLANDRGPHKATAIAYSGTYPSTVISGTHRGYVADFESEPLSYYEFTAAESIAFVTPTGKGSLACLYKINNHQSSGGCPIIRGISSASGSQHLAYKDYSSKSLFIVVNDSGVRKQAEGPALSTGVWYMKHGVYDDSFSTDNIMYYTDGIQAASLSDASSGYNSLAAGTQSLKIGVGTPSGANRGFDGQIGLVAFWDDVFHTPSQVQSFYDDPYQFLIPA